MGFRSASFSALLARSLAMLTWALACQSLLKFLNLLFDLLFAVTGRKEDIVGVLELLFSFVMAAVAFATQKRSLLSKQFIF